MRHASLFTGIGGFDLAASWMGWENVMQCEIDGFCQSVLRYHFPSASLYGDIRQLDGKQWNGKVDILTGGFPCQPFSSAGRRRGTEDDRHLWPEMLRVIREIQPSWVVGENVRGLVSWNDGLVFESVCADLEANGYEVQPFCIPACAVGAPHRRERLWFIAHHDGKRNGRVTGVGENPSGAGAGAWVELRTECRNQIRDETSDAFDASSQGLPNRGSSPLGTPGSDGQPERCHGRTFPAEQFHEDWLSAATRLCRVDDGLPGGLDGITVPRWRKESLKAAGNAIVPQVAYRIFRAIQDAEMSSSLS